MSFDHPEQRAVSLEETASGKAEIPRSKRWIMQSRAENRSYQIMVATPAEAPPPSGYPVIYVLDANSVFGTMVEAVRLQSGRPEKTGVVPAVVVGIGYETDGPFAPARYYDLTPMPTTEFTQLPNGAALPPQGGAEAFLQFIEEELKPRIAREFKIDRSRQTLFGHSLGGLFTLHVLFTKPDAFQCYIAGSPSIHWNRQHLMQAEKQFAARLEQESLNIKVLLGFGEMEKDHVSQNCYHARELSERLSAHAARGLQVVFKEFEDENHVSVLPVLISRALRFALYPEK
ncbi:MULTISPECIES: alpha/beta hydrolase [Brevibacillus]|jgi:predicted alpha/beta superfamily hydrolase|uniref:alpha/beta hydrolase n=1 Tax=Brevibacillus TaxID=55080 RepID=UPI000E3711D5|nr:MULTISPECIES: alpha/beta hydrolase [Brevibacillus]MBR8658844.1 alpha/beta hydrolase [Brevibacillus sp. NL20B1]MDT3416411.1 putative alpha/beta superfamily hydrolase [Brevibacillus aydinogluensis]NNV02342.1 alpha/beta hydrolase [Brevibacillus sp. MCWH]REK66860.1 MAG: enterobactin esterase [Brevibacillus sp.]